MCQVLDTRWLTGEIRSLGLLGGSRLKITRHNPTPHQPEKSVRLCRHPQSAHTLASCTTPRGGLSDLSQHLLQQGPSMHHTVT